MSESVTFELKSIGEKIDRKKALENEISTIHREREQKEETAFKHSRKRLLEFQKSNELKKEYPKISVPSGFCAEGYDSSLGITAGKLKLPFIESCAFIVSLIWFISIFVKSAITGKLSIGTFMISFVVTVILGIYFSISLDVIKKAIEFSTWYEKFEHQKKEVENKISKIDRVALGTRWEQFDLEFLDFVNKCNDEYKKESDALDMQTKELEEDELRQIAKIEEEIKAMNKELEKVTIIHSSLFEHAKKIEEILSIGRADNLKEAINIVLEDIRKDNEEAARRREAERQEEILEMQAMEQKLHNLKMQRKQDEAELNARIEAAENRRLFEESERRAQREAAEMRRQQEAYQRDMKRMAEKEAQNRKNALVGRCLSCANSSRCSSSIRGKLENCPSFIPRH